MSFEVSQQGIFTENPHIEVEALQRLRGFITNVLPDLVDEEVDWVEVEQDDRRLPEATHSIEVSVGPEYDEGTGEPASEDIDILSVYAHLNGPGGGRRAVETLAMAVRPNGTVRLNVPESGEGEVTHTEILGLMLDELQAFTPMLKLSKDGKSAELAEEKAYKAKARHIAEMQSDSMLFGQLEALEEPIDPGELFGPEGKQLTDMLQKSGLEPRFKQLVGEHTDVYYSKSVTGSGERYDDRSFIIAYVRTVDGWKPNLMYTSRSQAVWRWMPNYSSEKGWFGKGANEHGMTPPLQIQDTLQEINDTDDALLDDDAIKALLSNEELLPQLVQDADNREAEILSVEFKHSWLDEKDPQLMPNFADGPLSTEFRQDKVYGDMYRDVFVSNDGSLVYYFAHSHQGLAWLQAVTPTGGRLRQNGLVADEAVYVYNPLGQPAYEYREQAGYSGRPHPIYDSYVNFFPKLATVPAIQDYYRTIPPDHLGYMQDVPDDIDACVGLYLLQKPKDSSMMHIEDDEWVLDEPDTVYRVVSAASGEPFALTAGRKARIVLEYLHKAADGYDFSEDTLPNALQHFLTDKSIPYDYEQLPKDSAREILRQETEFVLEKLGLRIVKTVLEKHDETLVYEYMESDEVPKVQLVITRQAGKIIDASTLTV